MAKDTKPSSYLLGQEHITDREIDDFYNSTNNLLLRLERFRDFDKQYRSLEEVNTNDSEQERKDILNEVLLILDEITETLDEMMEDSKDIRKLFFKAKGALEEKLEQEKL